MSVTLPSLLRSAAGALATCGLVACPGPRDPVVEPTAEVVATPIIPSATSSTEPVVVPDVEPFGELDVKPDSFDFKGHPEIVARVADSPHAYFRFTQRLFMRAACKRFDAVTGSAVVARLHGDPHVEQYFVSDLGRGLSDYDDASTGPTFMDLTRFSASTILAGRMHALDKNQEAELLANLFRGYRDGLKGKALPKEPPAFAAALAAQFKSDKKGFIAYLENQLESIDAQETKFVDDEVKAYAEVTKKKAPKRPATFFSIKKAGRTKLGIGSALTRKYIIVLEGPTDTPEDDVVMELKEVADLSAVPCVKGIPSGAAEARASFQKAARDKKYLEPVLLPGSKFWVNEWQMDYEEARIKKLKPADLMSLVYEAGLVLAKVHQTALPEGKAPPATDLTISEPVEMEIRKIASELAEGTVNGWTRFRREVKGEK